MGLSTDDVSAKPTEAQRLLAETEEVVRECRAVMAESITLLRDAGTFDPESPTTLNIIEEQKVCDKILLAARENQVFIDSVDATKMMLGSKNFWDGPKRLEAMLDGIHRIKGQITAMRYGFEIARKINDRTGAKAWALATPDPPSRLMHVSPVETETEGERLLRKTEEEVERLKKALDRYAAILQSKGLTISDVSMETANAKHRQMCDEVLAIARANKRIFDESQLSIEEMSECTPKFTKALQNMHDDLDRVSREASVMNATIDKALAIKNSEVSLGPEPVKIIPVTRATIAEMPPLIDEIEPSTSMSILADGHAFLAIDGVSEESGGYNIRFILGDGIEVNRTEFSQKGIEEYLRGHVAMFNIKEMVFQVVVTADSQIKICRKFLWKSANDPKTIQSCLNYALTYLV